MDVTDYSNEEWRAVLGWEGIYDVSSHGRVRGIRQIQRYTGHRIRKHKINKYGYCALVLYFSGKRQDVLIHSLVAEVFICPRPGGMEVNHKDTVKHHNHYSNLEWITPDQNKAHAARMGLYATGTDHPRHTKPERWANAVFSPRPQIQGEKNCNSFLTNEQVREIKRVRRDEGISYSKLAARFNLKKCHIADICGGRHWNCVTID